MQTKIAISLFLLFVSFCAFSQPIKMADAENLMQEYAAHNIITLTDKSELHIGFDSKGKLTIYNDVTMDVLFLNDNGKSSNERSIYYSSTFSKITKIEAYTYVPNGKSYKKIPFQSIDTSDATSSSVFHDDSKKINIRFIAPQKGSIKHLFYREELYDPRIINYHSFAAYVPSLNQEFKIVCNQKIKLKTILAGDEDTAKVIFDKQEDKDNITYTWKGSSVKQIKSYSMAVEPNYYAPHVIPIITSIQYKDRVEPILGDVSLLYNWYQSIIKNINNDDETALNAIADSLITGAKTDLEKAKKIFYWVEENIKYIAFEEGMGGLIPRDASYVCKNRYGDCKDMANILCQMLKHAGIDAHIAWVGTRDLPYTYQKVPTSLADNHMITYCLIDGQKYFLDATCRYCAFGIPTSMILGKEALINKKSDYAIEVVPIIDKEYSLAYDSCIISIQKGEIKGDGTLLFKGYFKQNIASTIGNMNNKRTLDKNIADLLFKGNNKASFDNITWNKYESNDSNFIVHYSFTIPSYISQVDDEIYLNMNLERTFNHNQIDSGRTVTVENTFKYRINNIVVLNIPDEYELAYSPQNSDYKNSLFGYSIQYQKTKKHLKLNQDYYINYLYLYKDQFKDWNTCNDKLDNCYKEQIILKKIKK